MPDDRIAPAPAHRSGGAVQRRLWGIRLVVTAALAATLGMTTTELARAQARTPITTLAAKRGVPAARVRAVALHAAEPLLDEAVAARVLTADERRSLHHRLEWQGRI
jgi:hypothetical protein